ncbi:hypothetical protein ACJA25_01245 [Mycoplasmopsis hyopharyngis]|uniref:hypothetical protein n=1 Tax=Mycoplasmopsis hyopharyngis TaxID=29558 RepID=UPI0038734ECC
MQQKIIFLILILVLFIVVFLILYFLIRNASINEYAKKVKEIKKEVSNNHSYFKTTLIRYESLSKTNTKFNRDFKYLKKYNENLDEFYEKIMNLILSFENNKKHYKRLECKKNYNEIKIFYESYKEQESNFKAISENTINSWNEIDETSTKILSTIKKLEEYIDFNQKKLKNSELYLRKELNTLRTEIKNYEEQKTSIKIADVNVKIIDFKNKIKTYINKIDCMLNFEWTIYYNLEGLIQTVATQNPGEAIKKIRHNFDKFKAQWLEIPYQEVIAFLKNTYKNVNLIKREAENKKHWIEYWNSEGRLEKFVSDIQQISDCIDEKIKPLLENKTNNQSNNFLLMFEEFKMKKNETIEKLRSNKEEIVNVVELVNIAKNVLKNFNEFISLIIFEQIMYKFNSSLLKVYEHWYLYVLSLRNEIENNTSNDELFMEFENSFSDWKEEMEQITNNSLKVYNTDKWNKFINSFANIFFVVAKADAYKKMVNVTLEKIIKKQPENPKIKNIVEFVISETKKLNYEKAFDGLMNFIKKGRTNV